MGFVAQPRLLVLAALIGTAVLACVHHDPLKPRVPADRLDEAKVLKAPFGDARKASPEIIAEGKKLFQGKGSCFHCHGMEGKGDGPAAGKLYPHPPRNFTSCQWHEARTDGELFWVIDHGVPGTGMVDHVHDGHLKEIEAWKIVAYLRTLCEFR
ncbi:MAG: cytochrome c [Nitrospirota bacterium]